MSIFAIVVLALTIGLLLLAVCQEATSIDYLTYDTWTPKHAAAITDEMIEKIEQWAEYPDPRYPGSH